MKAVSRGGDAFAARRWRRGIERGQQETELANREEAEARARAARDFATAARAEQVQRELASLLREQLPTGPVGGTNTLGSGAQLQRA